MPTLYLTLSSKYVQQGLYRRSGVQSKIARLYSTSFEKDKHVNFEEEDIETLSGAIKYAFKQLTDPLFTHAQYEHFVDCASKLL